MSERVDEALNLTFNHNAFEYAKELITQGKINCDVHAWPIDKPTPTDEDTYLNDHNFKDYGKWFLAINEEAGDETKERYELPLGNFKEVYRSGIAAAKARAEQYNYQDVEKAANELLEMIDKQVCKA